MFHNPGVRYLEFGFGTATPTYLTVNKSPAQKKVIYIIYDHFNHSVSKVLNDSKYKTRPGGPWVLRSW